jgi:hypothetical protein
MKIKTEKHIILEVAVCLFLVATFQCQPKGEVYPEATCTGTTSLQGTWRLEAYQMLATGTLDPDPAPEGRGVVFSFTEEGKTGEIKGHTVANAVAGRYLKGDSCRLKNVTFGGTKVGEPTAWSAKVWTAMHGAEAYGQVQNHLYIYFNNRTERMIFRKE